MTSVHKEACTQLVLNSGSYHARSLCADPLKVAVFASEAAEGPHSDSALLCRLTLSKPPRLFGLRLLFYLSYGEN